jgi:hypothetical protein
MADYKTLTSRAFSHGFSTIRARRSRIPNLLYPAGQIPHSRLLLLNFTMIAS